MPGFALWMVYWCCLAFGIGEHLCTSRVLKLSNVSTELQSDVLLPCNFDPALLGSDMNADLAVVWKQINTTEHGLLEITLQGEPRFWNSKDLRIKPFPELSESGNFSVLHRKVEPSDLSLYRCELFNGTDCRIAYQEIELGSVSCFLKMITGALIGAVLLCLFITSVFYISKNLYANYQNPVQLSHAGDAHTYENPIYETRNCGGSMT